jgi:hypothetical protein
MRIKRHCWSRVLTNMHGMMYITKDIKIVIHCGEIKFRESEDVCEECVEIELKAQWIKCGEKIRGIIKFEKKMNNGKFYRIFCLRLLKKIKLEREEKTR